MIKHTCTCDRCGKEEDLKVKYCVNQDSEQPIICSLPDRWEKFGILPKYDLCEECSAKLKYDIEHYIHNFVKNTMEK